MNAANIPMAYITMPQQSRQNSQGNVNSGNSINAPTTTSTTINPTVNNDRAAIRESSNSPNVNEELFKLREKIDFLESNLRGNNSGMNASANKVTQMSFYDSTEPIFVRAGRLIASGPLSFASIITRDPFLRVSLLKVRKEKNQLLPLRHKNLTTSDLVKQLIIEDDSNGVKSEGEKSKVDEAFKTRLIENEGLDEVKLTNRQETQPFSTSIDYETETISKVQSILPEDKLMWMLVDKFFKSILAGFIPFVTEEKLRERINDIIKIDPNSGKREIKINKRFDFAYIGMLLIILRLTFLSVIPTSNNTPDEQYILANPITLQFINVAQMCLNQFRLLRRGALPVLQCSLFMRLYHKYAPEDGDGSDGGDSEVFLGMLLQMGNSIGLNRDMKHSEPLKNDFRLHNLWRMVWHEIVTLDLYQSLTMGNPILINTNCYDTELPKLEDNVANHNILDMGIWRAVVDNFAVNDEVNQVVKDILDDVLNLKKMCILQNLFPKITRLENLINEKFVSVEWILHLDNSDLYGSIIKTHKFKNYIELKTALYVIYYHIYLRTDDFEILVKMLKICMEITPLSLLLTSINNGKTNYFDAIFGFGAQLILVPTILVSLQKTNQLITSLTSRTLDYKYSYPKTPQTKSQLIKQLRDRLFIIAKDLRDCFLMLSSVYYHSWRISKSQNLIYSVLKNELNNLWDKQSTMNREAINLNKEVNHVKAMPTRNELNEMSINELELILSIVKNPHYETILKNKLKNPGHNKNKPLISKNMTTPTTSISGGGSSTGSTPNSSTIHIKNSDLTNLEIDKLWFQMMSSNNNQMNNSTNVLPGNEDLLAHDDNYAMMDFDKLMGDTSPYDIFGDIPFYHER
ncbi:hypothetical protein WICANDRAFT_95140 [Wickerhamomyces anomalus NRRL Y-366-8]|uniref:Xylanolytic transcriptional activator regulatory domain-containing protein n=1 Tax=Wickerhamomyces anomalus (strain ATCC 58044 / CBS 1984 / NCYC 433 / NRRL Y-366-8) TaxID=683960 RepID=A0A1E3NXZ8_WICAA|nr:uncharacterized protein WICANDRAFT_95140 [Wickerhamomyces anomalus NRRL Y-366-8]ODQ57973.1 hypothetical protein WICANDRAFT_95140 [Wickerhamomyces anomalus NRRL Y-366-8]